MNLQVVEVDRATVDRHAELRFRGISTAFGSTRRVIGHWQCDRSAAANV